MAFIVVSHRTNCLFYENEQKNDDVFDQHGLPSDSIIKEFSPNGLVHYQRAENIVVAIVQKDILI